MMTCSYFSKKFKLGYKNEYEEYFLAYYLHCLTIKFVFVPYLLKKNISFVLNAHKASETNMYHQLMKANFKWFLFRWM